MVYLVFKAGNSNKFYEITQNETEIYIKYGRIGSDGISIEKSFNTSDSASNFLINTVNEKVKKGYRERSSSMESFDGTEEERKRKFITKNDKLLKRRNYGKLTQSDESGIDSEDEAENLTSVDQGTKPTVPESENHKTFYLVNNSTHSNPLFYKIIINNSTVEVINGSLNDHKVLSNERRSFVTNALASKYAYSSVSNFLISNYVLSSAEAVECVDVFTDSNDTGTSSKPDVNKRRKVDSGVSTASILSLTSSPTARTRSSQTADKRKTVGTKKSTSKGKHNMLKNTDNKEHDNDDHDSDDPNELDLDRDQLSDYSQESDDGEEDEDNGSKDDGGPKKPKYEHKPGPTLFFTCKQGNSDKFYEITQCYKTVTCRYGCTGTQGTTITKVFHSEDGADNYVESMSEQKLKKGYVCETTANLGWAHYCVIC